MHYPIDRIVHTTAFVTPVVEHWLGGERAQWGSITILIIGIITIITILLLLLLLIIIIVLIILIIAIITVLQWRQ